jgi:hypothetical protein
MNEIINSGDMRFERNALGYNEELAGDFLVQQIEYLLPDVIESLQIPVLLDRGSKQRLEYSLRGEKGFRALPKKRRNKAIQQLKDSAFVDVLRSVQQIASMQSWHNSSNQSTFVDLSKTEHTASTFYMDSATVNDLGQNGVHGSLLLGEERFSAPDKTIVGETKSATDVTKSSVRERIDVFEVPKVPVEIQEPVVGRDIRGLLALLRGNRVVAFVENIAGQLIGDDVEKIEVPKKKIFGKLDFAELFAEYQALSSKRDLQHDTNLLTEFRLLDALLVAVENDQQWSRVNTRRSHLIIKKYTVVLSPDEDEELEKLDQLTRRRMYSAQDLPFSELAMLEAYAASLELTQAA